MIIFLDFDGVLHAHYGPHSERFCFLQRFESLIREYPSAQIVISSSWQLTHDLFFSPDIQLATGSGSIPFAHRILNSWI